MQGRWLNGARRELNKALDETHEELISIKMQVQGNEGMIRQICQRMNDRWERLGAALLMWTHLGGRVPEEDLGTTSSEDDQSGTQQAAQPREGEVTPETLSEGSMELLATEAVYPRTLEWNDEY